MSTMNQVSQVLGEVRFLINRTFGSLSFFNYLSYNLGLIKSDRDIAIHTDGYNIFVNPDKFLNLDFQNQQYWYMHELFHIALMHTQRKHTRNPELWNVACDITINNLLYNYRFPIPKDAPRKPEYEDLSTEEIYELLEKDQRDNNQPPPPVPQDLQGNESNSDSEGQGNSSGQQDKAYQELALQEAMSQARAATALSGQNASNLPAELQKLFDELEKPKLPWKIILQRWLNARNNGRYDFTRPHRRYPFYMPSRRLEGMERLDFVIDTSGSISQKEFEAFCSEIQGILDQFKPKELGMSQFDDHFRGTQIISKYTNIKNLEFRGGGGTCISDTLEALEKTNSKALIIFTDGYIFDLDRCTEPSKPVVWIVYDNPNFEAPFGKAILIDKKEICN